MGNAGPHLHMDEHIDKLRHSPSIDAYHARVGWNESVGSVVGCSTAIRSSRANHDFEDSQLDRGVACCRVNRHGNFHRTERGEYPGREPFIDVSRHVERAKEGSGRCHRSAEVTGRGGGRDAADEGPIIPTTKDVALPQAVGLDAMLWCWACTSRADRRKAMHPGKS